MSTPVKRNVLLNPGPATTTDRIKYAQVVPDICPRESEFGDLCHSISQNITSIVAPIESYTSVLFGGAGTAAVEAMIISVIGPDDRVLIIDNGAYGKRMCQIAETYGLAFDRFSSDPITPLDYDAIREHASRGEFTHLACVHHETTTGLLNDLDHLGSLCKDLGLSLMVDAMSSYAALPIDMPAQSIDFLTASSNKNLQGMAGIGFVICNNSALERIQSYPKRSFYLDLWSQHDVFQKTRQFRFTPPVQTLYALAEAIQETLEEGVAQRYARYSRSWESLVEGIASLGLSFLIPKSHHSKLITAICEPDTPGYSFDAMHAFFYERGYTIYPGKLSHQNTFRIANIGDLTYRDLDSFIGLLKEYLDGCSGSD